MTRLAKTSPLCWPNAGALTTSVLLLLTLVNGGGAIRYVNQGNPAPAFPYSDWVSAATNIQDAIDAAGIGDRILVTNGVYRFGGRVGEPGRAQTSRIALTKEVRVFSVNGPRGTFIEGELGQNPTVEWWGRPIYAASNSVRCAYVGSNCVLSGFTLTNGHTIFPGVGGGVYSENSGVVSNCVITGNSASFAGGGAHGGSFYNSVFATNVAVWGGGIRSATIYNCFITDNYGGEVGGGAMQSKLFNCTVVSNLAVELGGGVFECDVANSIVYHNPLGYNHTWSSITNSCTSPLPPGPGNIDSDPQITSGFQIALTSPCVGAGDGNYVFGTDLEGEPWRNPPSMGCDEPYLLGVTIDASYTNTAVGFPLYLSGAVAGEFDYSIWDFGDGTRVTNTLSISHAWLSPGEHKVVLTAYHAVAVREANVTIHVVEPVIHYVSLGSANPTAPYLSWETAATNIQQAIDAGNVGDTVIVTNGIYQAGGRAMHGLLTNRVCIDRPMLLRSVNGAGSTIIQGYQVMSTNGSAAVRCLYLSHNAVIDGFTLTRGATRDSGSTPSDLRGGGVFCDSDRATVSNCVLTANAAFDSGGGASGGTFRNCIVMGNWSDSGGGVHQSVVHNSIISSNAALYNAGGGALASSLSYCTLANNSAYAGGGAAFCVVDNSIVRNNRAAYAGGAGGSTLKHAVVQSNSAQYWGGGVASTVLTNCLVVGNSAGWHGGGIQSSLGYGCTVVSNSAGQVGGGVAYSGPIWNSVIYDNEAPSDRNHAGSDMSFSCTTPLPTGGTGNITNAPMLLNVVNGLCLQSNSPCINAGDNARVGVAIDLEGNPRVVGGTVDIGACEYQTPGSLISYAWLQQYGLATDGSADRLDLDSDGMDNWQEWRSGTDGTNALSILKMLAPFYSASGITVSWQSVDTRSYYLEGSPALGQGFITIQSNIVGQAQTTTYLDNTTNSTRYFYRVGVH